MGVNAPEQREVNPTDVRPIKSGERYSRGANADSTMGHITITFVGG